MVCCELHIYHELVLDQNVNDNYYSPPFLHEALNVEHKMAMLVIGLYHNTFSNICVKHQHYPEHGILCLSIFFYCHLSIFYLINYSMFTMLLRYMFFGLFRQTDIICFVQEKIIICESIVLILVVEHYTLIDINSAWQWHWYHQLPICHDQVHLYLDQL